MNFYKEFTKEQVFACAIDAYKGISTHKDYSAEERRETMEEILTELGKDYRSNKNKMFAIIEATLTEVLPQKRAINN
jgi:endo-alpha-1,4-polygalactosaminidase (GH114 family)